ncbi:Hypothetical protein CINCED_3A002127 [Cinara cedri]|uniref:Uncharacterized protein n=1 Tax=Cinara cedri TaxID=506608 RepID=A0A5E4M6P9_9HEMI|nr:Hypothetical protein CINCED_3A002127 [Cinara cedri]
MDSCWIREWTNRKASRRHEEQNIRNNGDGGGGSGNKRKMPPHPIRIAKTIDVIARITFPTAYAVFLIFFFIHYTSHPSHWTQ